jgi:hypothetical protein
MCSEFEQYTVLCVAESAEYGLLCVSVLFEIVATADAPPEFYSCLSRDAPRLLRISCDVSSVDGGDTLYRHSSTQPLSSRQMQSGTGDSPHVMFVGSTGGFGIQAPREAEEAEKTALSVAPDGSALQVLVGAEGGASDGVHLVLRAASAGDQPALLLEKEAPDACPGVVSPAGTSASALMGGPGTSYTWPSLRFEAGQCWVRTGGSKIALAGQRCAACAWHARSRSAPGSCPPFTQSTVWVILSASSLQFARLHSAPRPGGRRPARLQGCARDPKLADGAFVVAKAHRDRAGRVAVSLLQPAGAEVWVPLAAPGSAGRLEGVFQTYSLDVMREDSASRGRGWCLRMRALDLRAVLAARLRAAGAAHPDVIARSCACRASWTAAWGFGSAFPARAVVLALLLCVLLFPSTRLARISLLLTFFVLLAAGFEACPPRLRSPAALLGRG